MESISTEDMKEGIRVVNGITVINNMTRILLSMDVESMYPSLLKDKVKREIKKLVMETDLEIVNLSWQFLAIYISQRLKPDKYKSENIVNIIPKKIPGIKTKMNTESYIWSGETPTEYQIKVMLSLLAEELTEPDKAKLSSTQKKLGAFCQIWP